MPTTATFTWCKLDILEEHAESGKDLLELSRNLIALFEEYINLKRVRLPGVITRLKPSQLADASDIIISIINIPLKIKQSLLEETEHLCPRRPRLQHPEKGSPAAQKPA